jgi:hypothetical protein
VEAAASPARVLRDPLDGLLIIAAAKAQPTRHAFPLLADALRMAFDTRGRGSRLWARRLVEILGAPNGMADAVASRIAEHLGFSAEAVCREPRSRPRALHAA